MLAVFSGFQLLAQNVPNSSFETWSTQTAFSPTSWITAGPVSQCEETFEGSFAIKLENKEQNNTRSFVSTGAFSEGKIGGYAYDEQPLSLRFHAKYDLAPGDKAQVAAIFTLKGNALGYVTINIEGNSADTFGYFSVPITWQLSSIPDSVGIILSSIDLNTQEVNGDGYIIFDDLYFASISTRNKEIQNGSFNKWNNKSYPVLDNWYTTDDFYYENSGVRLDPAIVSSTTDGKAGKALLLKNQIVGSDLLPGVAFTGTDISKIERPSFRMNQKWKYLSGYYKYNPQNGDTAVIAAILFKNGVPIANAQFVIKQTVNAWTYFAVEIGYAIDIVPDSATVVIFNSNPDNPQGTGTIMYVDDVMFSDHNLGVIDLTRSKLTVYPNPFKDEIKITGLDRVDGATYSVRDATGKEFRSGEVHREMTIDMRDAGAGIYFLHIEGRYVNTDKILLKE